MVKRFFFCSSRHSQRMEGLARLSYVAIWSCSSQSVPKISSIEWNNGSSWALFSPKGGAAAPHLMGHMERITAHFSHTAPHRGGAALGRSSFERRYGCDFFFGSILCSQTMNNWLGIGRKTYTWCDQWCGNFVVGGGCRQRAVAARLVGVGYLGLVYFGVISSKNMVLLLMLIGGLSYWITVEFSWVVIAQCTWRYEVRFFRKCQ